MTYAELKDEIIKIMKKMDAFDFQNAYEYACEWFDETPMYSPMAGLAYLETGEAVLPEEFRQKLENCADFDFDDEYYYADYSGEYHSLNSDEITLNNNDYFVDRFSSFLNDVIFNEYDFDNANIAELYKEYAKDRKR